MFKSLRYSGLCLLYTSAQETNFAKFDATVEVSYNLNIDVKKADQQIRGAMVLPNGTGKTQRVLVFARGAKAEEAKAAGADFVGEDELVDKINGGWLDFDVVVATPDMMAIVGRLGRVLGPVSYTHLVLVLLSQEYAKPMKIPPPIQLPKKTTTH